MNKIILTIYLKLPKSLKQIAKKLYRYFKYIKGGYYRLIAETRFRIVWPFLKNVPIRNITQFEQKIYSQNGEDGIIKIIFDTIGVTNKYCVEFGVSDGSECNTRYLINTQNWQYLHMNGGENNTPFTDVKKEFITAENINQLFEKYNVPHEFDFLSIDIDYNTYWVWKAIDLYRPRVVAVEYNAFFLPTESKAVPYDPKGRWDRTNYFGASLLAFVRLGKRKGYKLIGCDSIGVNAFFIRDDVIGDYFQKGSIELLYRPPGYGIKKDGKYIGHPTSDKFFQEV